MGERKKPLRYLLLAARHASCDFATDIWQLAVAKGLSQSTGGGGKPLCVPHCKGIVRLLAPNT